MSEKNFGYLGPTFQVGLLKTIIEDKKFAITIIDVIKSSYFDGPYFKFLMENIKELYDKYKVVPNYDTLQQKVLSENPNGSKVHLDTLKEIKNFQLENSSYIKSVSLNFCRQQVVKKALKESDEIIQNGAFEEYDRIENLITSALQIGATTEDIVDISQNIRESLQTEDRIPFPTGINGIDEYLKGGLARSEFGIILAPTGIGKELPISEPVLTPKGWMKNGELKIGDEIIGSDGKKQYVLGVYPQGVKPIYKVEFTDNTFVNCGLEHLWSVNTLNMRTSKTRDKNRKVIYKPNYTYKTVKTSDMMLDIKKRGRYNYRLPIVEPIQFENNKVLIDPYLLGLLLGDGYLSYNSGVSISTKDDELFDYIKHLNEHASFNEYCRNDIQTIKRISLKSTIKEKLKVYDLLDKKSNNKFIPREYIYNSIDVRLSILQGLMDTDGYVNKTGTVQISTASKELSENIREIVLSLGGTVSVNTKIPKYRYKGIQKIGQLSYIVTISFVNNIVPFRLLRKVNNYRARTKYLEQKYVKSIKYSHDEEASCIKVSNADQLYVTRDYVLTHNTTVLTKFANSAFNYGANVLQAFFEDNLNVIRKKHYTIWTGIAPDNQKSNQDEVVEKVSKITSNRENRLHLLKLPTFGTSVSDIKNKIRRLESEGKKIDVLVLDYIDLISTEKTLEGEEWKGEGTITRALEGMADEFGIAIWTATQGNRDSMDSDIVTTNQMGGNIKKAQVGHVIISIAKTLSQKENRLANISILKSRIGKDGIVFQNCKFDNEYLLFDTESQNTLLGHEEEKAEEQKQHAADRFRDKMERENKIKKEVEEKRKKEKEIKDSRLDLELNVSKRVTEIEEKENGLKLLNNFENDKPINNQIEQKNSSELETIEVSVTQEKTVSQQDKNRQRISEVYKNRNKKKPNTG